MSRLRTGFTALILAAVLAGCSSTMPDSTAGFRPDGLPTVTPEPTAAPDGGSTATAAPATPTIAVTPTPGDGPVTASMEQLNLDGERYATLGDPNAPVTVVEFSDYG